MLPINSPREAKKGISKGIGTKQPHMFPFIIIDCTYIEVEATIRMKPEIMIVIIKSAFFWSIGMFY